MTLLQCVIFLQFTTTLALGQVAHQSKPSSVPNQPEAMVRHLYHEVVTHHPMGIPESKEMKIFEPYLSKALLHRIDAAGACYDDWTRQYPDRDLKPPFGWLESGLFSGDDEQASPRDFQIERSQSEKDGSFRVNVRLTWENPPAPRLIWRVAAIVIREGGHFVVDDVIYLKDEARLAESRLSEYLAQGCDGPRWVGFGDQRKDQKQ